MSYEIFAHYPQEQSLQSTVPANNILVNVELCSIPAGIVSHSSVITTIVPLLIRIIIKDSSQLVKFLINLKHNYALYDEFLKRVVIATTPMGFNNQAVS